MNGEQKDFLRVTSPASLDALENSVRGEPGFIDEKQLLVRLPVSRRTLGNWKAKGMLPFIKIGRRCLYDWASVQAPTATARRTVVSGRRVHSTRYNWPLSDNGARSALAFWPGAKKS